MTTFEEKYLKYKTKYLVLKKNLNKQNGGSKSHNIMNISNLSDTPVFNEETFENAQTGGSNDILAISNLTETPSMNDNQYGGQVKKNKVLKTIKSETSLNNSNVTTELNGGKSEDDSSSSSSSSSSSKSSSSDSEENQSKTTSSEGGGKIKFKIKSEDDSSESISDSDNLNMEDSSESLLSALEDSDSDS